ncbi:restriction endonuclease subunit S, partial [Parasutterella excrementihominis]|uniref:restriction endonuclease subunit S n=1 Tax=Parasutterella excrementihominis TaxID=487175 RepID=UPI0027B96927
KPPKGDWEKLRILQGFLNASFRSNSTRKEVWKRTLHIAFPKKINKNEIGKVNIQIPSLAEQRKIGIFFYSLDRLITLHQRKLEGLSKLKKSLLQKMFPKNGSLGPELRFPGFTGDWEQRELKDVAEIVGGGTPSTSVPAYWNGSIDWYSPTEIGQENFAKGSKRKISNEGLNNSSAKLLPAHKTILFTSRATIGEAAILEREGATNQGFQSIVTKEGVDVYFLYSYKHHLKKQALIKASGSTFLEISKNEVEGLHVPVPSGEEQAKIGSFFKLVDKAITLHQRKLESLKKLKKSLLQQMFV